MYDVLIIGAGFIGASLACGLNQLGLTCAIIDKVDPLSINNENRGIVLNLSSQQILHGLGIWEGLQAVAYPIKTVYVSRQGYFGITKLQATQLGVDALGYVIPADKLKLKLHAKLTEQKNSNYINSFWPIDTVNFDPELFKAKLIVLADGTHSIWRDKYGFKAINYDYAETAIVCNIFIEKEHIDGAYERFTDLGIIAALPFGKGRIKFVWSLNTAKALELLALSEFDFLAQAQAYFGYRLGKFLQVDQRLSFPLQSLQVKQLYKQNIIIIGNAANTLHPIAAQGLNLGLKDVAEVLTILAQARYQGWDINTESILQSYQVARQGEHAAVQQYMAQLHKLFQQKNLSNKWLQAVTVIGGGLSATLNTWITKNGSGYCNFRRWDRWLDWSQVISR